MDNQEQEKRLKWYENKYGPYIEKRGLHNWKNLFKKPTFMEIVVMCLLVGYVVIAFLYAQDTKMCKDTLSTIEEDACFICSASIQNDEECSGGNCLLNNISWDTGG